MKTPRNWKFINQMLVNRGNFTLYISEESLQKAENILLSNNKKKRGRPFSYNPYLILLGFTAKSVLRYGYRQVTGFMEMIKDRLKTTKIPNFRTLWWRINKMEKFGIKFRLLSNFTKDKIVGIVDSTGLKKTGSNEWCGKRYKVRKSWIKTHFFIDDKTGQILNLVQTKEYVHDNKMVKPLVGPFLDIMNKFIADGAYDSNDTFKYLENNSIEPIIPVRRNSSVGHTSKPGGKFRRKHVSIQFGLRRGPGVQSVLEKKTEKYRRKLNQQKWKEKSGYYHRPHIESEIWSFKKKFGEGISSKLKEMREKELITRANIHNTFKIPNAKFLL
jgi:Transposase DDE domain